MTRIVLLAAFSVFAALNVPLEVINWADIARTGEPVTAGVPLPEKSVSDLTKLRITDASGNTIPAQFRPLSKWWKEKLSEGRDDPSIKWVLCDFQTDVPVRNKTAVFLKDDNASGAAVTALSVTETADAVTVVTGPLQFVVSRTHFNLFDEAWLDTDGDNVFEASERIIEPGNASGGVITAGDWAAGGCTSGAEHFSSTHAPTRMVIEENGPMKVMIRIEGRHYASSGGVSRGLYGWQCFITAYAGKSYVDVQWALTNNLQEGNRPPEKNTDSTFTVFSWPFADYRLSLDLALNPSATQSCALLGETEAVGTAGDVAARLLQKAGGYAMTGGPSGVSAKGGVSLSDGTLGVRIAMRDFAPNNPKGLSVSRDRIDIELFPDTAGTSPYWLEPFTRKNHRMRFEFFAGTPASGALLSLHEETEAPLRMLAADRAWYRDTHAWERGFGIPAGAEFQRIIPSSWTRLNKMTDLNLVYNSLTRDWTTYGHNYNFNCGGSHDNLVSCFYKYALTGNPRDFELWEAKTFYFNDRVQCQFSPNAWQELDWWLNPLAHTAEYRGCHQMWGTGAEPVSETFPDYFIRPDIVFTQFPDAGHQTQLNIIEYYQLTGDPATRDAMEGLAVYSASWIFAWTYLFPVSYDGRTITDSVDVDSVFSLGSGPRYIARPSMVLNQAYEVTGDDRYFYPAKLGTYTLRNVIRRHPAGYLASPGERTYCDTNDTPWHTDHPGVAQPKYFSGSDFQIGIAMEALYSWLAKTGDEEIRDALIEAGASMLWRMNKDSSDRWTGFVYQGWCDYGFSGKRYDNSLPNLGYNGSMSEGFGGFLFSYLASGRTDFLPVINDGWTALNGTWSMEMFNIWEALHKRDALDSAPPAAVTDLSASGDPVSGLRLTWTAPGGDNTAGRATRYQVKISTTPLCDMPDHWNDAERRGWPDLNDSLPYTVPALLAKAVNFTRTRQLSFWAAKNLHGEPLPQPAGSPESMTLTGLDTSMTYYFALVAYDSAGNVSGLSNVVSAKGVTVEKSGKGLCAFLLSGNEPNPFNPATVIRFSLPGRAQAVLIIHDLRGRMIRTLASGAMEKGAHRVCWDGRDDGGKPASSGLYVVRLSSQGRTLLKKMALVK